MFASALLRFWIVRLAAGIRWRGGWYFFPLLFMLGSFLAGCGTPAATPAPAAPASAAKILVGTDGMYALLLEDLHRMGLDWEQDDLSALRLFHRGQPQPLWVDQHRDTFRLRFYGQASQSRYVRDNVYWLALDEAASSLPDDASSIGATSATNATSATVAASPQTAYTATVHLEEQRRYTPRVAQGDHWFWEVLRAPQAQEVSFATSDRTPGTARVTVEAWASTESPQSPDHHLRIRINEQVITSTTWDGIGRHTIQAPVPDGLLTDENTIEIEAGGETEAIADIIFIDWIRIDYPRLLIAQDDRLTFESSGGEPQLRGFDSPVSVFDITDPYSASHVLDLPPATDDTNAPDDTVARSFQGAAHHRYQAVGAGGYLHPTAIIPVQPTMDLRAAEQGAEYIAIGPTELLEPLSPLLAWRESQDLPTQAVPIEAIYNQFNHGLPEPAAIQEFLRYASQHWQPAPRFVLLVGDYTYDPRGYIVPDEANRVPTVMVPTIFGGETASDVAMASLDNDARADLAVGRLPARSPQQVTTLVEKILRYEQQPTTGAWRNQVLAVADGQEERFRDDAQGFLDHFPSEYEDILLAPEAGTTDAAQQLQQQLSGGARLVAYFGHGSLTQWGKDTIFATGDVAALDNGEHLPVMLHITCLTGLFTHPEVESLAETLLWQEQGGAVAVLAPTSLTLPRDQSALVAGFAEAFVRNPDERLGTILLDAWQQMPVDDPGTREVKQTFLLFGDPALRMP